MTIVYLLVAIVLLGILITVHEWGHFIAARLTGIQVNEFAVGFGPRLAGWTSRKHGTRFSLRLIPMGGFCAFYGEDDGEGPQAADPRAFGRQKVWKRMLTVLMGPGMNFILAFVVLTVFFWAGGAEQVVAAYPYVSAVEADSPAAAAGLRAGDVIAQVNGTDVLDGTTDTLLELIAAYQAGDAPLALTVLREGETLALTAAPFYDAQADKYRLGVTISASYDTARIALTLPRAAAESWDFCLYAGGIIFDALGDLVTTGEGLDQTAGPVGVISMVTTQVQQGGLDSFINLLVVISINLGIMNLLPIPALDGCRLLFLAVEAVRRKPVSPKWEARVHMAGYVLLLGLMLFFTFKDVGRLLR